MAKCLCCCCPIRLSISNASLVSLSGHFLVPDTLPDLYFWFCYLTGETERPSIPFKVPCCPFFGVTQHWWYLMWQFFVCTCSCLHSLEAKFFCLNALNVHAWGAINLQYPHTIILRLWIFVFPVFTVFSSKRELQFLHFCSCRHKKWKKFFPCLLFTPCSLT